TVPGHDAQGAIRMQEKILVGHKLRRFRQSAGLSQTAMAEALDISPSYLNLLEHNQRPLTVALLLKLGNSFDIDMKSFAEDDSPALMTDLAEVFADPLLSGERVSRRELQDLVTAAPSAARGMLSLFQAYRKVRDQLELNSGDGRQTGGLDNPVERVRDLLQQANNYFPEAEAAADEFRETVTAGMTGDQGLLESLIRHTAADPGLRVRILPAPVMGSQLRRYDYHRREILLSEALLRPQRTFHLLVQLALIRSSGFITDLTEAHGLEDEGARSLFRTSLAGYFAAAVMMPYDSFLEAARDLRYDLDLLGRRFGASFEQVCHRLTSLNAPQARGIPFFFIRVDDAGNISKRLAAGGMQFAKNGGTCPRWNIHKAFRTPDRMLFQAAELPNGQKFFTIARTVPRPWAPAGESPPEFAVALGCEMHHARDLAYADEFDGLKRRQLDPIGIGCAVCERMDCAQRAHPPVGHEVRFDGHTRRIGLYDLEG
ncbi:MAG: short-chain fatty acyl-CoA regulator family protein, partial [Pseudomonadota bacterium]|nr:short-chain fatty acyl-CoA regulator family protein [Pseudomonadota bacterium]